MLSGKDYHNSADGRGGSPKWNFEGTLGKNSSYIRREHNYMEGEI